MALSLSILNLNFINLKKELKKYKTITKMLHIDVMDGNFVENISFGHEILKDIVKGTKKRFTIDTHLMVLDPIKHIDKYIEAGSDMITFHAEATENIIETIKYIKQRNKKAGISINPGTDIEIIKPYLNDLDIVLVMSVWPGKGGQTFLGTSVEVVKELKRLKDENGYKYKISIDGGINQNTLYEVKDYIDIYVVGSFLTKALDVKDAAKSLEKCF